MNDDAWPESLSDSYNQAIRVKDIEGCGVCGYAIFFFKGKPDEKSPKYHLRPGWYHVAKLPRITCPGRYARPVAGPRRTKR